MPAIWCHGGQIAAVSWQPDSDEFTLIPWWYVGQITVGWQKAISHLLSGTQTVLGLCEKFVVILADLWYGTDESAIFSSVLFFSTTFLVTVTIY